MNLVAIYVLNRKCNRAYGYWDKDGYMRCSSCHGFVKYDTDGAACCVDCKSLIMYA